MKIPFTKMHGLGNDFVVLDLVSNDLKITPDQARQLADRHFGIGADQVLLVEPPSDPAVDFNYRIFNVDGEEVEHCGNGARCFARFVHEAGLTTKNPLLVNTVNRTLQLQMDEAGLVSVEMGTPELDPARIPFATDQTATRYRRTVDVNGEAMEVEFTAVSMGNPHAVIIVEDLAQTAVKEIGSALGQHPDFPAGVNVGFMQRINADEINLRVYERGAGETMACGTGACAAVVAGCLLKQLNDRVRVNLTGGQLLIYWPGNDASVVMSGPATTVYEGIIEL